ncbi:MAG: hypothetical protein WCT37_00335 [Patescibacteria group bacterium]|jgi:hypothetical protein
MIKKFVLTYLILTLAILFFGGLFIYFYRPAVQPVVNTNTNVNLNQPSTAAQIIPPAKTNCTDKLDTACWNTYRHTEYGLLFKYPREAIVNGGRLIVGEADIDVKYISFKFLNNGYSLLFYFEKGNPKASLNSRTGFGSGDFVSANKKIQFGPVKAQVNYLIYNNKIKEIYYSQNNSASLPYDNIKYGDYIFRAELTFGDGGDIKYDKTFVNVPEVRIAEKILETLKFF